MRKRRTNLFMLALLWTLIWTLFPPVVRAEMEWRVLKDLDLKISPLDVAPSADGQRLFILTPGEILVYSLPEDRISDRVPVGKEFDRIASLPRGDVLTISSTANKSLQVILLESVYKIDVTGHPFKGRQEAAVTIAVFTDYQ